MKKHTQIFTIILLSVFATSVQRSVAESAPAKVVVVDIQRVAQSSKFFAEIQEKLGAEINKKGSELEKIKKEFDAKLQKFQQGAKDMNVAAREKLQEELAGLDAQMKMKQNSLKEFAEGKMREAEQTLIAKIQDICKKLNYDIVIPGALHVRAEFDMTDHVVKELDKDVKPKADAAAVHKKN